VVLWSLALVRLVVELLELRGEQLEPREGPLELELDLAQLLGHWHWQPQL
jgi:hypothetical protein